MLELQIDNRLGGIPRYRLLPKGENLLRVPDVMRKSVAFVCYRDRDEMKAVGTCLFLQANIEGLYNGFVYVVTVRHIIDVIRKESVDQKVYLRMNLREAETQFIETEIDQWLRHPTDPSVDLAIHLWEPFDDTVFEYNFVPDYMTLTDVQIEQHKIGIGDDVFIVGLFASHSGQRKNLPIVRTGNIAMMPEEPVWTKDFGYMDAYLIEARSIGGLSGSPVYAYLLGERPQFHQSKEYAFQKSQGIMYLLGFIHGHWDLPISDSVLTYADEQSQRSINMGIAIVVPATKLQEVLNQPEVIEMRDKKAKKRREKTAPTPDATDASLTKEEFEKILKKVSRPEESPPDEGKSEA